MEILLSHVFTSLIGSSAGPEVGLFKRFQKEWTSTNKVSYFPATDDLFQDPVVNRLQQEMLEYLPRALGLQQPRDDYQEFLKLSLFFLGGGRKVESFRAPGPIHHARWMGKGIYVLKIFLFRSQFHMTTREVSNVTNLALFISLVYIRYWNEAPLAIRAPYNNVEFLARLKAFPFPNQSMARKSISAFSNHLWFLSEHLCALAFFDDRVSSETREQMVRNLQRSALPGAPWRLLVLMQ